MASLLVWNQSMQEFHQAPSLAPLWFIILVYDITPRLSNSCFLYADDVTIMCYCWQTKPRPEQNWNMFPGMFSGAAKWKTATISSRRDAHDSHPSLQFFGITQITNRDKNVELLGLTSYSVQRHLLAAQCYQDGQDSSHAYWSPSQTW